MTKFAGIFILAVLLPWQQTVPSYNTMATNHMMVIAELCHVFIAHLLFVLHIAVSVATCIEGSKVL